MKQGLSYIVFYPLRIFYNRKFILMATSLGRNAVVIMRDYCTLCITLEKRSILNIFLISSPSTYIVGAH